MKLRKPRTVTGRVAERLREAVIGRATELNRMRDDLEYVFMLVVAQATQQGLDPADFDNDRGTDALYAIFLTVREHDRELIRVTPAWRRVVISARGRRYHLPLRPHRWRKRRDDLDLRTSS